MHKSELVLIALLSGDRYGLELKEMIESATGESFKIGSLYPVLARLEEDGLAVSRWGEDDSPGARRRYYSITDKGREVIAQMERAIALLKGDVKPM